MKSQVRNAKDARETERECKAFELFRNLWAPKNAEKDRTKTLNETLGILDVFNSIVLQI